MAINKHDWEHFLNQATVKLTGSSQNGLKAEAFDVLTEFFNDSSCWTTDISVPYQPNTMSYPLEVPEGRIIRLVGIADYGTTPPPTPIVPNPNVSFTPALISDDLKYLILKFAPTTSGFFQVRLVTNVALPTSREMVPQCPDWVLPVWHVGLLDGLLGKMMSQPAKAYSNATWAAYHLKRFRDAIARARIAKLRSNTNGAAAWQFPQQFRSQSQQSGVPAIGSANERSF